LPVAIEGGGGPDTTLAPNPTAGIARRNTSGVPTPAKAPAVTAKPPGGGGGAPAGAPAATPSQANPAGASWPVGSYTKLVGKPEDGAVPAGEYNVLESNMQTWEALVGYSVEPSTAELLQMANQGIQTLRDFGQFMAKQSNTASVSQAMPWANYGLSKDEYQSAAATFGTEYKKITGNDISPDALQQAFQNPRDPTGGLLNVSQYSQQLMNDAAIQKQFGWVKYGLDFSAWTQQKLSLRTSFGRDINDAEAATILQYGKAASGSNMGVTAKQTGQQTQQPAGVGGSVVR
jgi:hypothetical protein